MSASTRSATATGGGSRGVDAETGQIAAERLTDRARVIFEGDYRREHVTLGYATTLHAAQGITVGNSTTRGSCFTVLSDQASRAMAYVGMTRGKDENHAFIYQPITGEGDHEHNDVAAGGQIHTMRRGNKYAAAHYFRMILANDDRPRTMHAEAERTDRAPAAGRGRRPAGPQRRTPHRHAAQRGVSTALKPGAAKPPTNGSPSTSARPQSAAPNAPAASTATPSNYNRPLAAASFSACARCAWLSAGCRALPAPGPCAGQAGHRAPAVRNSLFRF